MSLVIEVTAFAWVEILCSDWECCLVFSFHCKSVLCTGSGLPALPQLSLWLITVGLVVSKEEQSISMVCFFSLFFFLLIPTDLQTVIQVAWESKTDWMAHSERQTRRPTKAIQYLLFCSISPIAYFPEAQTVLLSHSLFISNYTKATV